MFRSPSAGSLPNTSATQIRFVQNRIRNVEKHFAEICTSLAAYTRKIAGQRDKGDQLSQVLHNYAASENLNKNLNKEIKHFADSLAFVSDYRDICIHRIEETVIEDISTYSAVCKSATEDIKSCHEAQEKEVSYQKHVNKLRQQNPLGRMQITKAESDLQQAVTHSVRLGRSMEDRIDKLEKKKLGDLHKWMKQLILIEMSLHSSALSILTKAFQQINQADVSSDLEEFRNSLRLCGSSVESSPLRSQSVPMIALPKTPSIADSVQSKSKIRRSQSFADYRFKAESLDSLKVEEYEELQDVNDSNEDD